MIWVLTMFNRNNAAYMSSRNTSLDLDVMQEKSKNETSEKADASNPNSSRAGEIKTTLIENNNRQEVIVCKARNLT